MNISISVNTIKTLNEFNNINNQLNQFKNIVKERQIKNKAGRQNANKIRNKKVLQNAKKTLALIILNQLTTVLVNMATKNSELQELVNKTNDIIDKATTPELISKAIIIRNNALSILTSQQQKFIPIKNNIETINSSIQTFSTIVSILSSISSPTSISGVGVPINLITKISKAIEKANILVNSLNIVLAIIEPTVEKMIYDIENLISQLHNINNFIENNSLLNTSNIKEFGMNFGTYKGYKFAIKEENNPKFTIQGNKRHYAVAFNGNVEVLRSDYSFTLDPNDLIEQLKLIIDSRNL